MAKDNNTTMYLVGGGLLIALFFAMSKKSSASTSDGNNRTSSLNTNGLTRLSPTTPVVGRGVSTTTTQTNEPFKLRKVGSEINSTNTSFVSPITNAPNPTLYGRIVVSSGSVNVRSEPNTTSSMVGSLSNNDNVSVQSVGGNTRWYSITSPYVGYVYSDYVSLNTHGYT